MKNKVLLGAILPVLGLGLVGVGTVSAHGLFWGGSITPEEIATRQQKMFEHQVQTLQALGVGVTLDEVKDAWAQAKTVRELAIEKGVTEEQLQQKMRSYHLQQLKSKLQDLVDRGVITQAQADKRYETMQNMSTKKSEKMMMGMRHGFGF